ncbi:MAG: DUF5312 family protein [Treponema sp.]
MAQRLSAFDTLVETISTEEAQAMLANIEESMKSSKDTLSNDSVLLVDKDIIQSIKGFAGESFFTRLLLKIRSFFSSTPVEVLHEQKLIFKLGKRLQRNYCQYIDIKKKIFLIDFYETIKNLRKAQLFFNPLLSAYEHDKGHLYLLVSSFLIPNTYEKLLKVSDPFTLEDASITDQRTRSEILKTMESIFSTITSSKKAEIYLCAQAIEWMKRFCNVQIDRILLKFTVNSPTDVFCPVDTMGTDLNTLAAVLNAVKPMPRDLLRALFLLSKQDVITSASADMGAESTAFVSQALEALNNITYVVTAVPMADCARYASQKLDCISTVTCGGEDWFLLFKNTWKKRFGDRWLVWTAYQKKIVIGQKALELLKVDELKMLPYRPWEGMWVPLQFKREFVFNVINTFFYAFYPTAMHPILEIILLEGNFCRRENLTEYTSAFTSLEKQNDTLAAFEGKLSPEGQFGQSFNLYKEKNGISIKNKNNLELLMRDIEIEAKQIVTSSISSINTIIAVLNGILNGEKKDIYAPLNNWTVIQGDKNDLFQRRVNLLYAHLLKIAIILGEAETIEVTL